MSMRTDDVFAMLSKRIDMQGATPAQIQEAVNKYLSENPVDSVTKANILKALGYTPADQEDVNELNEKLVQVDAKFELIDSFEVTEEIVEFVRTEEPNGTPYDFQKIKVVVEQTKSEKTGMGGIICAKDLGIIYITSEVFSFNTKPTFSQYIGYIDKGVLKGKCGTVIAPVYASDELNEALNYSLYTAATVCEPGFSLLETVKLDKIEYLKYSSLNSYQIPVGTKIEIYAVRS